MSVTLKQLVFAAAGGVLVTLTAQAAACDRGGFRPVYRPAINYHCQTTMYQRPVVQQPVQPVQPWMQPGFQGPNPGINVTIQGQPQAGGASATALGALGGGSGAAAGQQNLGLPQQNLGLPQQNMGLPQQNMGLPQQSGGLPQQNAGLTQPASGQQAQPGGVARQGGNFAPQNGSLAPTNPANTAAPTSPAPSQEKSAADLALEALMGTGVSETAPAQAQAPPAAAQVPAAAASAPQATAPIGSFTARVPSGATVRLSLNQNGTFAWIATSKDGKASNFQGSYTLRGGSLTLVRTDSQKLEGTLTPKAGGFDLRLSGQESGELSFVAG
jgi:hypothetical protein